MKKKSDGLFLIVFIVVVLISLLYLFQSSYAKYRRNVESQFQGRVASWNITVNNEDISNETTLTNAITPTFDANPYVKTNTIAPGSTGYFDIQINALNVDVDFTYTITGEVDDDTPLLDLQLTNYIAGTGGYTAYDPSTGIVGEIQKNKPATNVRIFFAWVDDPTTESMDNADDTDYAQTSAYEDTKVNITIHFEQKR